MTPWLQDPDCTLYQGDCREVLRELPAESVDCVATSPPFYGLRDYQVKGQIGLEATPDEWVAELVGVFRECRRVIKPGGTLWVECGDSYHGGGANVVGMSNIGRAGTARGGRGRADSRKPLENLKPKDLLGQPFLLAFALRADGWYWRQCIVWHKPNAMPESVTDRCTTAHSYVLLFSKQARYHFDADAISEPAAWERWGDQTVPKYEGTETSSGWMRPKTKAELVARGGRTTNGVKPRMKNARSVWTIPTRGYSGAHFATWPEALAERIIKAGCPESGTILDPFAGSGTTALVARRHGLRSVNIELSEPYCELFADRLSQLSLLPLLAERGADSA